MPVRRKKGMRDRQFGKKSRRAAAAGLAAVMTILSAVPAETGLAAEPVWG